MSKAHPNIAVIVGSLRKDSINKKLAHALERLAGHRAKFHYIRIDDLPLYNQDFDQAYPAVATRMKDEIKAADAILFVSPEYNRSMPGVLKNAIDVASRPWGTNSFAGKPGAVIGTSSGAISTALMQQHLRNACVFLDIFMMAQPESFLRYHEGLIADDYSITDEGVAKFLGSFVDKYLDWVKRFIA
ncbi:MAG: NAD(P)H-dependent oxidoreductase [Burkholderiaceae bacterium]|nr:MAG: NAD(P)H-dependent oxidoreductase [Burkholderiaceae bacterium]